MECSRPPGDLTDAQRWARGLAAARFELVDSAFFQNVGNPWTAHHLNLLGLTRVCFLQRRTRGRTYGYPRMAQAPQGSAEGLRRERGRRGAMYNQRPGDFEQMVRMAELRAAGAARA
ncbi:unnamed protein product [Prorocentrum cordatum]|uniref:Uncharacterized protein n=1 Tax=Prorocentrum cordatum TaxID=2364126 RepID=A0ABN9XJI7_9DINO|nr:unnamed protein product [Polarella glacialis]